MIKGIKKIFSKEVKNNLDIEYINVTNEKRIRTLGESDDNVNISNKIIKLQEECGEVAQAYLGYAKSENASASSNKKDEIEYYLEVIEECGDVINVALDIANYIQRQHNVPNSAVRSLFEEKLDKWENKQRKIKEKDFRK